LKSTISFVIYLTIILGLIILILGPICIIFSGEISKSDSESGQLIRYRKMEEIDSHHLRTDLVRHDPIFIDGNNELIAFIESEGLSGGPGTGIMDAYCIDGFQAIKVLEKFEAA